MYGTQARHAVPPAFLPFENDVKMYGTQARQRKKHEDRPFENDVKMYGTQAVRKYGCITQHV